MKNIMVFGAVAIALLMVSSATAVTMPHSNESLKSGPVVVGSINYVQPGIYLSGSEQRKILSDALISVDDLDAYQLLQAIIEKMDLKGFVDSNDIEQIISDNNLNFSFITSGPITTGDTPCAGDLLCLRRPLGISKIPVKYAMLFWWAYDWATYEWDVNVTVSTEKFTENHIGWAIGFSGISYVGSDYFGTWCVIHGSALLFFVRVIGNSNSQPQSTPQSNPQINPSPQSQQSNPQSSPQVNPSPNQQQMGQQINLLLQNLILRHQTIN